MLSDADLNDYYAANEAVYRKVLDDIKWDLDQFIKNSGDEEVQRAFNTARIHQRVKTAQSLIRKCRREQIEDLDQVSQKIEDILGIRIAVANKESARILWEYLQKNKGLDCWFCEIEQEPHFVPYTIEEKNNYSLRSGYQAYHVTFHCTKRYPAYPQVPKLPVEIQIMSRLWEFWSEYSREYFYGREGSVVSTYLPYNIAISKILDSADDLMTATTDLIRRDVSDEMQPASDEVEYSHQAMPEQEIEGQVGLQALREWFETNVSRYFGNARIPSDFFLSKIADDLSVYRITLEKLGQILDDYKIDQVYKSILRRSNLHYLPPHEQILTKILLSLERDEKSVIEEVNPELRPLGIVLYPAPYG